MLTKLICKLRGHNYVDEAVSDGRNCVYIGVCSRCNHNIDMYYMCRMQAKMLEISRETVDFSLENWMLEQKLSNEDAKQTQELV